ncbi:MAG: hypothetical protein ACRCS8_02105 [Brevinema sp.]
MLVLLDLVGLKLSSWLRMYGRFGGGLEREMKGGDLVIYFLLGIEFAVILLIIIKGEYDEYFRIIT